METVNLGHTPSYLSLASTPKHCQHIPFPLLVLSFYLFYLKPCCIQLVLLIRMLSGLVGRIL